MQKINVCDEKFHLKKEKKNIKLKRKDCESNLEEKTCNLF